MSGSALLCLTVLKLSPVTHSHMAYISVSAAGAEISNRPAGVITFTFSGIWFTHGTYRPSVCLLSLFNPPAFLLSSVGKIRNGLSLKSLAVFNPFTKITLLGINVINYHYFTLLSLLDFTRLSQFHFKRQRLIDEQWLFTDTSIRILFR